MTYQVSANLRDQLARYKAMAAKRGKTWQDVFQSVRYERFPSSGGTWQDLTKMKRYASDSDREYYADRLPDGWRVALDQKDSDEWPGGFRRATGYYTDNFQDAVYIGVVLQLPARDGVPCYVPAIRHSDSDGVTIWPLDSYDEAKDAARTADRNAELAAEEAREYYAKDQAEQQTEEARQTIADNRARRRQLIAELRLLKGTQLTLASYPTLRTTVCERIAELRTESREAYKRINVLADNFWLAVE